MTTELCPGCVSRYQNPDTGICDVCANNRLDERYGDQDRAHDESRKRRWRERQRRHRERESLRPVDLLDVDSDPLDVTQAALLLIAKLHKSVKTIPEQALLADLAEMVKQLGWGPEDSFVNVLAVVTQIDSKVKR